MVLSTLLNPKKTEICTLVYLLKKLITQLQAQMQEPTPSSVEEVKLTVKWSGQEYPLSLSGGSTVLDLKQRLAELTNVLPSRQKLLGLKTSARGKQVTDETKISDLDLKNPKIMMMGTPEAAQLKEPEEVFDVVDDFDYDPATVEVRNREENIRKLEHRIQNLNIKVMNPPREGKHCLVLDIDYTLFDNGSTVEHTLDLMRPYLHEFLTAVYPYYDIIIWSANSMKWIELKMRELGVFSHQSYKITFCLDRAAMITVSPSEADEKVSKKAVFDTKGLAVIWGKFPEFYTPKNTIHFDDLKRNFIMNPQNGLQIKPYKKCAVNRTRDRELLKLTEYLLAIKDITDFTQLDHAKWKKFVRQFRKSHTTESSNTTPSDQSTSNN